MLGKDSGSSTGAGYEQKVEFFHTRMDWAKMPQRQCSTQQQGVKSYAGSYVLQYELEVPRSKGHTPLKTVEND